MPFFNTFNSGSSKAFGFSKAVKPNPPTGLSAVPSTTSVAISFTAPVGPAPTNFEYALSTNGGSSYGSFTALSPVDTTSPITVSGLTANTAYFLKLRTVSGGMVSDDSTAVSFTTLKPAPTTVEYLVIAGGGGGATGGGGGGGGGGGAGGYQTATGLSIGSSFTVTMGAGAGADGTGGTSVCAAVSRAGGNPGGSNGGNGGSQGSGGFGGGGGTGNDGAGGGGGGAGGAGSAAPGGSYNGGGNGGPGAASSITGSSVTRAGGGGGGARRGEIYNPGGSGGSGGGGLGASIAQGGPGRNGTANTGSGGGGGAYDAPGGVGGGSGGSGIVIIRYADTNADLTSIPGGLSWSKSSSGGYTIYTFTGGTGTITV